MSGHVSISAPYLIPVVGPGRYQVHMLDAYAAQGNYPSARSAIFDVERGEQAGVQLTFDRME